MMFGIGKKPEIKKEVVKMGKTINKRFEVCLDENGETKEIPDEAFAMVEHIKEYETKDNGISMGKGLRICYSFLAPVSKEAEPEPVKQEERSPVVARKR